MRLFSTAALVGVLALSGCIDIDMTAEITGADEARVSGYMEMERSMVDMMGGAEAFCPAEEGGTVTLTDTLARCDMLSEGTFAEVFETDPNAPTPAAVDQGDGTVLVTFPIGQMFADAGDMRSDPQMAAAMGPMLEGHSFTIRVTGAEIVSTNGTLSEDGLSASFTLPLPEVLNPDFVIPETFETVVRY